MQKQKIENNNGYCPQCGNALNTSATSCFYCGWGISNKPDFITYKSTPGVCYGNTLETLDNINHELLEICTKLNEIITVLNKIKDKEQ